MVLEGYIYWITENIAGGPIPYDERDYEYLRSIGVQTVVSLVESWEYEAYSRLSERQVTELLRKLGIMLVRCPTMDGHAPDEDSLLKLAMLLDENDRRGIRTYVHCVGGMGRTPTVLAAFLVYRGYSTENAFRIVSEANPDISITDEQYYAVKALELLLRQRR